MGRETHIEWCDSTLNLMMGCDGCELWNPKNGVRHCYAGDLTGVYGGRKGWPKSFDQPAIFGERLDGALKWSDLAGKERPEKPWLNGLPRMIFLNDMGDTFTESLPIDWLADLMPRIAASTHVFMVLTKRAGRMLEFSRAHPLPPNVWPGVSVTSQATMKRVEDLLGVQGGGIKWVSAEPLLGPVEFVQRFNDGSSRNYLDGQFYDLKCRGVAGNPDFTAKTIDDRLPRLGLVILGGESGRGSRPCNIEWIRKPLQQCRAASVAAFVKQLGRHVHIVSEGGQLKSWFPNDSKGGDMAEWDGDLADLRVREMPNATVAA